MENLEGKNTHTHIREMKIQQNQEVIICCHDDHPPISSILFRSCLKVSSVEERELYTAPMAGSEVRPRPGRSLIGGEGLESAE